MSASSDFVSNLRTISAALANPNNGILTQLAALSAQATLMGFPANFTPDAFEGANCNQSQTSVTNMLSTYNAVLAALTANNSAGLSAIFNGMA